MSRAVSISFPVKSAAELASHLGLSKARKDRIFTIVARTVGKGRSRPATLNVEEKSKHRMVFKNKARTSRSRQQSNAKGSKAAAR
jgi:hypothetical protein